jgi:hypothetical protein
MIMNRYIVRKQEGYSKHCTSPDTCAYEGCRCSGDSYTYYEIYDRKKRSPLSKYDGNKITLREIAQRLNKKGGK